MDYGKQFRSFVNSHYLSEGVRMSFAILVPVIIFGYCGMLAVGLTLALGALCVSITDNPGPIQHRRNGVIICSLVIFFMSLAAGFAQQVGWVFIIILPVCCFVFSMIGVYGARATSIGLAALLILVLQTEHHFTGMAVVYNALYLLTGGVWYILLSQVLYSIRPYKIIQQALGEYVMAAAAYLRAKAGFYETGMAYEAHYDTIFRAQVLVQEKQTLVAELIFKTRSVVKESTHTGRVLMMIFLDVADLFEIAMTSHQNYEKLHKYFDETGILAEYKQLIQALAGELEEIGIALQSGRASGYSPKIDEELIEERKHLQQLRLRALNPSNIEGFISLRHILDSIDEIASRIRTLHHYTSYDKKLRKKKITVPDPEDFISHQPINPQLVFDNLSFRSNIFRHSLRISAAALFAYLIAGLLPVGHSYWILLTVIIILKPAYSLTRRRNFERLSGTIMGTAIGALLLYLVKDKIVIVGFLGVCMVGAYTFMRKRYLVSVVLMTVYLLLMFHLLYPHDFRVILTDRILDTAIGSVIAFIFSYLLSPVWEYEQVNAYMLQVVKDILRYYQLIAAPFTGKPLDQQAAVFVRRNSWVSLANFSDAFNRMLSEPRSKQKNIEYLHQFVTANHMLASHIATLSYYADPLPAEYIMDDYLPLINATAQALAQAENAIEGKEMGDPPAKPDPVAIRLLDQRVNELVKKRQQELELGEMETATRKLLSGLKSIADQFYFIHKISIDVEKISRKMRG